MVINRDHIVNLTEALAESRGMFEFNPGGSDSHPLCVDQGRAGVIVVSSRTLPAGL